MSRKKRKKVKVNLSMTLEERIRARAAWGALYEAEQRRGKIIHDFVRGFIGTGPDAMIQLVGGDNAKRTV